MRENSWPHQWGSTAVSKAISEEGRQLCDRVSLDVEVVE